MNETSKSGRELIDDILGGLSHSYDPVKAHEYYERTKLLKGRKRSTVKPIARAKTTKPGGNWVNDGYQETYDAQVSNITAKLERLRVQLHALLSKESGDDESIALSEEMLEKATKVKQNLHAAAAKARSASSPGTA